MRIEQDNLLCELCLPPGMAGSGRRRYAAAMWYFWKGDLTEESLEVYRTLALDDRTDPGLSCDDSA
jgi:hypothetical protein